jgi:hypothetical protein
VAIAALLRALVRHVVYYHDLTAVYSAVHRALIEENRWRAQRYRTDGTFFAPYRQRDAGLAAPTRLAAGLAAGAAYRPAHLSGRHCENIRPPSMAAMRRDHPYSSSKGGGSNQFVSDRPPSTTKLAPVT